MWAVVPKPRGRDSVRERDSMGPILGRESVRRRRAIGELGRGGREVPSLSSHPPAGQGAVPGGDRGPKARLGSDGVSVWRSGGPDDVVVVLINLGHRRSVLPVRQR